MCETHEHWPTPESVELTCKCTGKPITVTNKYGMFCEDLCDLQKCIEAEKQGQELIRALKDWFTVEP